MKGHPAPYAARCCLLSGGKQRNSAWRRKLRHTARLGLKSGNGVGRSTVLRACRQTRWAVYLNKATLPEHRPAKMSSGTGSGKKGCVVAVVGPATAARAAPTARKTSSNLVIT